MHKNSKNKQTGEEQRRREGKKGLRMKTQTERSLIRAEKKALFAEKKPSKKTVSGLLQHNAASANISSVKPTQREESSHAGTLC